MEAEESVPIEIGALGGVSDMFEKYHMWENLTLPSDLK